MDTRENEPSQGLSALFRHAKDFATAHEVEPEPEKLHQWSYDDLRCSHESPNLFTIRADFEHFLYRVSIWCQFQDSVKQALRMSLNFTLKVIIFSWPNQSNGT